MFNFVPDAEILNPTLTMKKKNFFMLFALLAAAFVFPTVNLNAQTKDEIGTAYNAALQQSGTDLAGAVASMSDVIGMCEKLGAEADDLKANASKVISGWQYSVANNLMKEKNLDAAIPAFEKSLELANKYNDAGVREKATGQLPKVYFAKGNALYKTEDYTNALAFYDKALAFDKDYTKVYLMKGQAFKKKGESENMKAAMDKAIELGNATNDTATVNSASKVMSADFLARSNKAFASKAYGQAIDLANQSLVYGSSSATYLILAVSYNAQSKADLAIESANKGIALETKPEKLVDFYFQLGKGYEIKKDNANACANYKKVTSGANKAAADYQIKTVLKCQ
jgi:tetratricopeptide (TPR) repeat protein